jgi:hypothetical protein
MARHDNAACSNDTGSLRSVLVALALTALAVQCAHAFGAEGHQMIAALAEHDLSNRARAEVNRLLALEPGATMVTISTWADETRTPATAAWHYVNLPRDSDCQYDAPRDCPDGQCVVDAIERQRRVLTSNAPDMERLVALKYLVHLVADVHQPLHAGHADDRGGNRFQVQAYGQGTNLHAVWDTALITHWPGGPAALFSEVGARATSPASGSPARWAQESCRIVASSWFYPPGHKLEPSYAKAANPVLVERMSSAAGRLASLLNASLGSP